jgi:hypothetical protein
MCFSCSVIDGQRMRVCVFVHRIDKMSVGQNVWEVRIKNEPNKFKTRNEVNNLKISAHDKIVVKMFVCFKM